MTAHRFTAALSEEAARRAAEDASRVEAACEAALQAGDRGVIEVYDPATMRLVAAYPDASVPYGMRYVYPQEWDQ